MKVFWSWQSDHPGKISRHFVREALEKAISEIRQDPEIEEAARDAELDHDRKGVPGSPDLARIILDKILHSDVFVADVTPVGNITDNPKKRLINSNVAIELGYALGAVSDRAMLMILNEAFGTRDDLPFDLKHKAGPITYNLSADATKEQIASEQAKLIGILRVALGEIVVAHAKGLLRPFEEVDAAEDNPGRYFQKGEVLAQRGDAEFRCNSDALLYMRILPTREQPRLGRVEAMQMVMSGNLGVLNDRARGWSHEQNKYGVIVFESDHEAKEILSATQLFRSREIWGFDAYLLSPSHGKRGIPTGWHEHMLCRALHTYVTFARQVLNVEAPLKLEVGATEVAGYVLHMDRGRFPWDRDWGPIQERHVVYRCVLETCEPAELDRALLASFDMIFDAAGAKRPEKYNNFPGDQPGQLPRG